MEWQDRQTFTCLEPLLSWMVMLWQEEQKENPQLGQPYSLVNGENRFVQLVQEIRVSYTIKQRVKYLKSDQNLRICNT